MAGKFMHRGAIIDSIKSEQRTQAIRKRLGQTQHPIEAVVCGCPDPTCGAFHAVRTERTIPTTAEADRALLDDKKIRKASKRVFRAIADRKKRNKN